MRVLRTISLMTFAAIMLAGCTSKKPRRAV